MARWKLTIEYDGSHYHGWQAQKGEKTVQKNLENALANLCQQPVRLHVAGRTDKGVHALGQVAHADIPRELSEDRMRLAIQAHLNHEAIAIVEAKPVSEDFHARFSAQRRHYVYRIMPCPYPPTLWRNRVWGIPKPLDIEAMQQAANRLLGHHDFSSFRAAGCQANSPMRTLEAVHIKQEILLDTPIIDIYFTAPSFLYHQVRNMISAIAEVGLGRLDIADITEIMAKKDRTAAPKTAPACGLYFYKIEY